MQNESKIKKRMPIVLERNSAKSNTLTISPNGECWGIDKTFTFDYKGKL